MTVKLLSTDEFRAAAREGKQAGSAVYRLATDAPAAVQDRPRTLRFVFSDGSIDRAGDTIAPDGWQFADFLKNPVALWAHDSRSPPVGRASNVRIDNQRLIGDIEFAPAETYEFADTVFRLIKGGYINAVSVGFIPLEWKFVDDKTRGFAIDFLKQELLEISPCPVPCNPNALQEARAKGIDTRPLVKWAEQMLDEGGMASISKTELAELRVLATPLLGKSGRRISKENCERLTKAIEHVQSVIDSNEPDEDPAADPAPPAETEAAKRLLAVRRRAARLGVH